MKAPNIAGWKSPDGEETPCAVHYNPVEKISEYETWPVKMSKFDASNCLWFSYDGQLTWICANDRWGV